LMYLHSRTNIDVLQVVMQYTSNSNLERRQESNGMTPLLRALEDQNIALALELLALGARGDVVDKNGNGSFHHAADGFATVTDSENRRRRKRPS
jgi:ankyrin repeat protein